MFSWFCYIIWYWNIDDWGVSTWIFRSDWCSWIYWLAWFAWIFWIWQVWFVAWNIWNYWFSWFRWICWIIWIFHTWCWWEVRIIRFWNQASKWFIGNLISYFWLIWSHCLRSSFCLIWVVSIYNWNSFFTISVGWLIPCCCICCWILFSCECEAILNFISWSLIACSFKCNSLFSWFCYIVFYWSSCSIVVYNFISCIQKWIF